ncbi:MAG: hemin uptake protein HemP [Telluria sp.]
MESPSPHLEPVPQRETLEPPGAAPLNSRDLFGQAKAVKIEHDGKIYELRLTRLNKLILTA